MNMPTRRQTLAWGSLLLLLSAAGGMERFFVDLGIWGWAVLAAAAGCGVFGIYLTDRSDKSLLIPAYMIWAISGLLALIGARILQGTGIATYVLTAIALPFVVAYVRDRRKWWALMLTYTLLAIGMLVGLIGLGVLRGLLIPAYVLPAIAIPFIVAYARNRRHDGRSTPVGG